MTRQVTDHRTRKRPSAKFSIVLLFCGFFIWVYLPQAQAEQPSEYRLKVAFLYNFAAYTEWPDQVSQSLDYCIYGDDPFGANLQYLRQRKVNKQEVVVKYPADLYELTGCQAVFIARSVIDNLGAILALLNGKPVLTIADTPGSCQQGVMINMAISEGKVVFEANLAAAKQNGLRLSAQLLRFATEVYQ